MPRLTPGLIRNAARIHQLLPLLLRECRDLPSARRELRWLNEFVVETQSKHEGYMNSSRRLLQYVQRRAKGEPLQYILGTQPFGELEILCRNNVLIPRPETETYTLKVGQIVRDILEAQRQEECEENQKLGALRIADFCTGTGCIALLLHSVLNAKVKPYQNMETVWYDGNIEIYGYDISLQALKLAKENLTHNLENDTLDMSASKQVKFRFLDVLELGRSLQHPAEKQAESTESRPLELQDKSVEPVQRIDIIVSNPPYISPSQFKPGGATSSSVRKYEPMLALVPPPAHNEAVEQADQFYISILNIAQSADTRLVVLEVGDNEQAHRVRELASKAFKTEDALIEIWRDDSSVIRDADALPFPGDDPSLAHCRVVVIWRREWKKRRILPAEGYDDVRNLFQGG